MAALLEPLERRRSDLAALAELVENDQRPGAHAARGRRGGAATPLAQQPGHARRPRGGLQAGRGPGSSDVLRAPAEDGQTRGGAGCRHGLCLARPSGSATWRPGKRAYTPSWPRCTTGGVPAAGRPFHLGAGGSSPRASTSCPAPDASASSTTAAGPSATCDRRPSHRSRAPSHDGGSASGGLAPGRPGAAAREHRPGAGLRAGGPARAGGPPSRARASPRSSPACSPSTCSRPARVFKANCSNTRLRASRSASPSTDSRRGSCSCSRSSPSRSPSTAWPTWATAPSTAARPSWAWPSTCWSARSSWCSSRTA